MFFEKNFKWSEEKFQKTLILVFEVIVQETKAHFLTFSSETKIMKITHSEIGHKLDPTSNAVGQCMRYRSK